MHLAILTGKIQLIKRGTQEISHLLFADDMLVFCRGNTSSVTALNSILEDMYLFAGLEMNKQKSKLFLSKGCRNKTTLANLSGVSQGSLPMKYLGLPLTSVYLKARHFASLIDATRRRGDGWMLNLLSFPGRIELIKSVLHNLPSYWVSSFKLPCSVIREHLWKVPLEW